MKPTLTDTESQLLSRLHDARVALGRGGIDTAKAELNAAQEAADKALNEAAELRAAVREWREAARAEAEAHKAWTDAVAAHPPVTPYVEKWQEAKYRKDDAVATLRRFAGLLKDEEQA